MSVGSIRTDDCDRNFVDIANSNGNRQTVRLQYRTTTPRGDWSGTLTTTSSTDGATIGLSALTPGTEYEVQASLESAFPTARTRYDHIHHAALPQYRIPRGR